MSKSRIKVLSMTSKRLFQEAGSVCGFCSVHEVAALEIHHIDSEPAHNALENLLVVCGTCHGKINDGVISEADVRFKKREVQWLHGQRAARAADTPTAVVNVNINGSRFRGDIAQNLTKITTPRAPRIAHPPGSLGADLPKKGYVDYLLARYFDFRQAGRSYGDRRPFSHAEVHRTIQRHFGHKTFFMPSEFFERLVPFLQKRVDDTIQGRNNASRGVLNYHSFADHILKQNGTSIKLSRVKPAG